MPVPTSADELAQGALDAGVITERELRSARAEVDAAGDAMEELSQSLVRKGLLTNYQLERLQRGFRDGYVYGDYTVLYLVGSGTFARVFRAIHRKSGEVYAIKVMRSRFSQDPKRADFFRREGELGKKLVHANIVPIHDVVAEGGSHYLVMDFVEGRNLRETYRVKGRFEWREATHILCGILAGLQYAFQQGVTHRDLKMSNVLVASDGTARIVDFGLAALDGVSGDAAAGVDRTVEYAALEKATGVRKDDTRSDVFFVGCMMHQMLSGVATLPEGRDRGQRFGRDVFSTFKPIVELVPEIPLSLAMVLGKALELDPDRRYQTPGDMLTDLKLAVRRAEGSGQGEARQELASQEGIGTDGKPRRLMVVESDTKRQDVLRDLFKKNGYRVLVSTDPDRVLDRFATDPKTAEAALFCAATIGAPAVEAFNRFGEGPGTRDIPAVLLLEESQGEWAKSVNRCDHRSVAVMPLKLKQLRGAVSEVLAAGAEA
ncbi:MAG: serine/threonine-protein kinase [Planctomycetota bacterium]